MATQSNKEMSDWIKFFTAAGIPPGPAAKYAMAFIDNRINKSMLMDLTKEYLKEMGVSVMGDVISILKHAKSAHSQYERERPILEAMPQPEDGKIELKRQTTPGNRMLEHYMRKEGMLEESTKVKVTTAMAARLGAVPSTGSKKKPVGLPESVEVVPVKKARRVPPEEEGAYVISLPKGSTERTKKILEQKTQDTKSSVFARLGGAGPASTTASPTTSPAGQVAGKSPSEGIAKQTASPTVFNRLGTQSQPLLTSPVLQYHGVLKSSPKSSPTPKILRSPAAPKAKTAAAAAAAAAAARTAAGKSAAAAAVVGVQERLGVQRPEVSTTTLTHMDAVGLKHSLQARLGSLLSDPPAAATASAPQQEVTVLISEGGKAATLGSNPPAVLSRLGSQKPARGAGAKAKAKPGVTLKPGLTRRLGGQRASAPANGAKVAAKAGGVMARLGHKKPHPNTPIRTGAAAAAAAARGRVQKRLGMPAKSAQTPPRASLRQRLGPQKAEASSTTPTFTVTLAGDSTTGSTQTRKRKRKSAGGSPAESSARSVTMGQDVFSRLGSG